MSLIKRETAKPWLNLKIIYRYLYSCQNCCDMIELFGMNISSDAESLSKVVFEKIKWKTSVVKIRT